MNSNSSSQGVIFALVGPSGCGKTALIEEMLKRFSNDLVIMRSLTTRQRRETDDDRATRFVNRVEFEALRDAGRLVQWVEYDGNLYGDAVEDVDAIVNSGRHAIRPLVEESVPKFRSAGYTVLMVRVAPEGAGYANRSKERELLDRERAGAADLPKADVEIVNRFGDGGFAAACDELHSFIASQLGR
jgi:guanylate kinase